MEELEEEYEPVSAYRGADEVDDEPIIQAAADPEPEIVEDEIVEEVKVKRTPLEADPDIEFDRKN